MNGARTDSLRSLRDVDVELDAAVLRSPLCGGVVRDGPGRADALDEHLPGVDAAARECVAHRFGAPQRELLLCAADPDESV